ncbi:unnamed protein product [Diplocarpon coronariae]|nr:hypothetical protein JHW43_001236 [Diplocarpon mali]
MSSMEPAWPSSADWMLFAEPPQVSLGVPAQVLVPAPAPPVGVAAAGRGYGRTAAFSTHKRALTATASSARTLLADFGSDSLRHPAYELRSVLVRTGDRVEVLFFDADEDFELDRVVGFAVVDAVESLEPGPDFEGDKLDFFDAELAVLFAGWVERGFVEDGPLEELRLEGFFDEDDLTELDAAFDEETVTLGLPVLGDLDGRVEDFEVIEAAVRVGLQAPVTEGTALTPEPIGMMLEPQS